MSNTKSSYKQIFKATSIFGGVQILQIIIKVIRSKFIAVLLGPEGMGIANLLTTTITFISALTNFGLGTSAVKNVSEANSTGNPHKVSEVVLTLRRLVWATGLLGSFLTLILSSWLSKLTFGSKEYTLAFIWISITLLFNQISIGQTVLLQGLRKIKYLAQSSLTGSLFGLIVSVPIYYFWGIDGIVPAIIVTSIVSLLRSWYFARKVQIKKISLSINQTKLIGKNMLSMGFMLSLSSLITLGVTYIVRVFISKTGSVEQVGFYAAGIVLVETYVGLVFKAMGTDYYPRLSEVNENNNKIKQIVNEQASVAILILAPIIIAFIVFIPFVVKLLYSERFLPIIPMVLWAITGLYFRGATWSMGFITLAKGDSKLFFKTQLFMNIIVLTNSLVGFHLGGLTGVGLAFLINYIIHFFFISWIAKRFYQFRFEKEFYKIFIPGIVFCGVALLISQTDNSTIKYIIGSFLFFIISLHSIHELNKKLDLKDIIMNYFKNIRRNNRDK